MTGHRDLRPVRHDATGIFGKFLDETVDIIPTAAIEPGRMVAQFPEDLVHFEGGHDRFDQYRRANGALGQTELGLGIQEHFVPQPRLKMALDLRQVEVGPGAA
jgi:hypothetical protein